ncbi:sugar phosphate isomerase/epimerase family protein [Paenibacillus hodogayensis]|uniref:Sugar phosphate isomerase/epimerase family protein n=1 Tax=Paenibacillus hodogayensis TaxID=279208 RepID=A0ABV5VZ59_9BACL
MPYLSLSTWSLHRLLGTMYWTVWDEEEQKQKTVEQPQPHLLDLLDLPAEAARRGFQAVEICHFHFPSTAPDYLLALKQAFSASKIALDTLLLDYGDLTNPSATRAESDMLFIRQWISIASACGARRIRVIAGEAAPTDEEAIRLSASRLLELERFAADSGVELITENFKSLTSTGTSCLQLLEQTGRRINIIADFGNFKEPHKSDFLSMILPFSVSVHAKAQYDADGNLDRTELERCLRLVQEAGYEGPIVMIYDGPGDMWEGIERVREVVQPFIKMKD